jgi:MSHA biogenesis protein MshJ
MLTNFTYLDLRDKWLRLSRREQLLVTLVLGAAAYFLVDALVFAPQARREQALLDQQKILQAQVLALSAEIAAVDKNKVDNLAQKKVDYLLLKKQAALLESLVQSVTTDAPKIRNLMTEMLDATSTRVKVTAIKTLPVKALAGASKPQAVGAAQLGVGGVYKHGLEIELRGSYLDLMDFLTRVETANPKLLWSTASLTAGTYPENTMRVSVFLLSTQSNL